MAKGKILIKDKRTRAEVSKSIDRRLENERKAEEMLKEQKEIREKLKVEETNKGDDVYDSYVLPLVDALLTRQEPYFSKTPTLLLYNSNICCEAKTIFAFLHSKCREKNFSNGRSIVQVSLSSIRRNLGIGKDSTVRKYINQLINTGWVEKIQTGKMKANKYKLLSVDKDKKKMMINQNHANERLLKDRNLSKHLKNSLYNK